MSNFIDAIPENLEIINKTDLTMTEVTRCVNTVVKLGKISKGVYRVLKYNIFDPSLFFNPEY